MLIPISWLANLQFCEYSFYLQHVLGVKVETPEMVRGLKKHKELLSQHEEQATIELTVEQAMNRSLERKESLIMREVYVRNEKLIGSIDEVLITPELIVIIDDKPRDKVFSSHKTQLYAYAIAFNQNYNPKQEIMVAVRDWRKNKIVWRQLLTNSALEQATTHIEKSINKALSIINNKIKPRPTTNPNKCKACKLKDYCKYFKSKHPKKNH